MSRIDFKILKILMLFNDIAFIVYWTVTLFHLIPDSLLFKDYNNHLSVVWNWSFFPLDIMISITGITSLSLSKAGNPKWRAFAFISLVLTFCSGLQAISYWAIKQDFDVIWWASNLFLLIYPIPFIIKFIWGKNKSN